MCAGRAAQCPKACVPLDRTTNQENQTQRQGPTLPHCSRGSRTPQVRPAHLDCELRNVQVASPLLPPPHHPQHHPHLPRLPLTPTLCWQGQNQWQLLRGTTSLTHVPLPLSQQLLKKSPFLIRMENLQSYYPRDGQGAAAHQDRTRRLRWNAAMR